MKKSITAIILTVFAVVAIVASVGVTAAIWTDAGGESGIAPNAPTTDWNVYAKYVTFTTSGATAEITGWSGTLLEDMIFPSTVSSSGTTYTVTAIRNTVFESTSMKSVPITLWIPPTVTYVDEHAFSGLTNLRTVHFGGLLNNPTIMTLGQYAFAGCTSLSGLVFETSAATGFQTRVCFQSNVFIGCNNLSAFSSTTGETTQNGQIAIYYTSSNTAVNSSNWVNFKAYTAISAASDFPFSISD